MARRTPASCLGLYSQNVNTLRPTLDSFVWSLLLLSKQAYAFAVMFTGFNNTSSPTLDGFVWPLGAETDRWRDKETERQRETKRRRDIENREAEGQRGREDRETGSNEIEIEMESEREHNTICGPPCFRRRDARRRNDTHRQTNMLSRTFLARKKDPTCLCVTPCRSEAGCLMRPCTAWCKAPQGQALPAPQGQALPATQDPSLFGTI